MTNTARNPLPITNRNTKLSLIHIAKKNSGIADDAYRILLEGAAGVNSAAQIEYEYQFNAVMKAFENLGFKSTQRSGGKKPRPQWTDAWGGTEDQRAKLKFYGKPAPEIKRIKPCGFLLKESPMWIIRAFSMSSWREKLFSL